MSPLWRKTAKPHTRLMTEQNCTFISATGFLCHLRHIARHRLDFFPPMFATETSAPVNGETGVSPNTPFLSRFFYTTLHTSQQCSGDAHFSPSSNEESPDTQPRHPAQTRTSTLSCLFGQTNPTPCVPCLSFLLCERKTDCECHPSSTTAT